MSDPATHINFDIPCARCGYNLRSLSRKGECPECGHPVWRSLLGEDLAQADPAWLRLQRLGLLLAIASVAIYIEQAYMFRRHYWAISAPKQQTIWEIFVPALAMVCGLAATWLITTPEPRRLRQPFYRDLGSLTRLAMIGAVAFQTLYYLLRLSPYAGTPGGMAAYLIADGLASRLLYVVSGVGYFILLARLARRVPSFTIALGMWGAMVVTSLANLGFAAVATFQVRGVLSQSWNQNYSNILQGTEKLWWIGAWLEIILSVALFVFVGQAIHKGRATIPPPSVTREEHTVTLAAGDHRT